MWWRFEVHNMYDKESKAEATVGGKEWMVAMDGWKVCTGEETNGECWGGGEILKQNENMQENQRNAMQCVPQIYVRSVYLS